VCQHAHATGNVTAFTAAKRGSIDALWTAKGIKALTWVHQLRQGLTSSIALRLRVHLLDGKCKRAF